MSSREVSCEAIDLPNGRMDAITSRIKIELEMQSERDENLSLDTIPCTFCLQSIINPFQASMV